MNKAESTINFLIHGSNTDKKPVQHRKSWKIPKG